MEVTWSLEDKNLFTLTPKPDSILELYAYHYAPWKFDDLIGKADPIKLSELLETTNK